MTNLTPKSQKLREKFINNLTLNNFSHIPGFEILPDGRIAYTKDNEIFFAEEDHWNVSK